MQAAFLNVKLATLDADNLKRREIAKRYLAEIKNPLITLPNWDFSNNHVFHLFVIRAKQRDKLQKYLLENEVIAPIKTICKTQFTKRESVYEINI